MRMLTIIFSLALSFFTWVAIAGEGHDHSHSHDPVSQSQAEVNATKSVSALVDKDKIDKSWKSIKATKSEKKQFDGKMEWVVIFNNKTISDKEKQTLYVFLTLSGEYLAANYTGK